MDTSLTWETAPEEARKRAQAQHLPILLFFHNPG